MPELKDENDFGAAMFKMLDTVQDGTLENLKANQDLVFQLGDYCRKTKFYSQNRARGKRFAKSMSADQVYRHMVFKIARSDSRLIADGVAILLMPIVADKLAEACRV